MGFLHVSITKKELHATDGSGEIDTKVLNGSNVDVNTTKHFSPKTETIAMPCNVTPSPSFFSSTCIFFRISRNHGNFQSGLNFFLKINLTIYRI